MRVATRSPPRPRRGRWDHGRGRDEQGRDPRARATLGSTGGHLRLPRPSRRHPRHRGRAGIDPTAPLWQLLADFDDIRSSLLGGSLFRALALALYVPPLLYLFTAEEARAERVRHFLIGIVVGGPILLGLASVLRIFLFDSAADTFADPIARAGIPIGTWAEDSLTGSSLGGIYQGLLFVGSLGTVIAVFYTSLWALRTGLLTRMFATLGMALGVLTLLAPEIAELALAGWMMWFGLVILNRIPRGRPPAWDAAVAIPWPKPGDQARSAQAKDEDEGDELIEGEATEISDDGTSPHADRRTRAKKKKRKQRR